MTKYEKALQILATIQRKKKAHEKDAYLLAFYTLAEKGQRDKIDSMTVEEAGELTC